MTSTEPTKHSINGSCRVSKRSPGRREGTVSTASIAWVVASLLAVSQPSTGVCAFTQSTKTSKAPCAKTKYSKPNLRPRRPSCLNYRNTESQPNRKDRFQQYHVEIFKLPWKTSVRGQIKDDKHISSEIDQQFILDEYLESIDRRYKRVHQGETKDDRSQRGFTSAWAWLTADESSFVEEEKRRKKDNALCVLGLAELASVRLLQKHHLPIDQSQKQSSDGTNSMTIDVRGDKDSETNHSNRGILAAKNLARFLNRMQKAYSYRCVVVSMQLRAGFYHTLRNSRSTVMQFLVASSIMSRCITRFASQTAVMATYVAVIMTRLFEGVN